MFNSQKQILPGSRVRTCVSEKVEGEKNNNNNIQK